jgi:hypothetical protein
MPSGEPFRWDVTHPIRYAVNAGPFGARSHAWAVSAVQRAFQTWQAVPTARLQFQAASDLRQQINGDSVADFLNALQPADASPILLDSDGSITDTVLGDGASAAVLGFSAPYRTDPLSGHIQVSFTVVNGSLNDQFSDSFALSTFIHELGHFLNLDHSQLNADELYDGDPTNDAIAPEMFYRGPNDQSGLHQDDRAWISWLYPNPAAVATTGVIRGRVLLPDGQMTGLQGIEVIARRAGDPQMTAVSGVSGYRFFGPQGGASDPARLGEFLLPGLPPGSYTVEVRQFSSFPSISVPVGFLVGGPKFWQDGSTGQDMSSSGAPIVVSAGQEVNGIDIVLNGESLGEPKPVAEQEPNELPNAQPVELPAVISGEVEAGPGDGRSPAEQNGDLHDFYQVTLQQPMTVTAILSAARPQADLDLDVLSLDFQSFQVLAESTQPGTPPEVVQILLPAGRYFFGVHLAGTRGSAYTLRLLATPSPDPAPAAPVWITYLTLGDVTASGATVHWQTTDNTPAVIYYNQPLQETGSPARVQDHSLALTGLALNAKSTVTVFAPTALDPDLIDVPVTTARAPRSDGEPRIVAAGKADFFSFFDFDIAEVVIHLSNPGDAEAGSVQIDQVLPATGWKLLSEVFPGSPMPSSIAVGSIGAGGVGDFVVRIVRLRGSADPAVRVHGSYIDPSGATLRF